ncbi:hypothetical protein [Halomarina oriensis]|uniref:Uncharacterized protein n=1 Tax=Halomarina oriensis TaxID=671145 RepID=A0A6B0GQ94_9EURY|nr:hypothetical protein [Halomarina oriensis]MWG34833.1 hypothetical protein [Halomarina oriensis]
MTDDICGAETAKGTPCQNPAGENGRCHIPTHNGRDEDNPSRDPKLTVERQEKIASMLEDSHSIAAACRCNGIGRSTFYEWLQKGDAQEEGIYADFSDRVARARGAGERRIVDELLETAREKGDTRTMLSVLKSRYPDSWDDASSTEDSGTVNIHLSPTDQ